MVRSLCAPSCFSCYLSSCSKVLLEESQFNYVLKLFSEGKKLNFIDYPDTYYSLLILLLWLNFLRWAAFNFGGEIKYHILRIRLHDLCIISQICIHAKCAYLCIRIYYMLPNEIHNYKLSLCLRWRLFLCLYLLMLRFLGNCHWQSLFILSPLPTCLYLLPMHLILSYNIDFQIYIFNPVSFPKV